MTGQVWAKAAWDVFCFFKWLIMFKYKRTPPFFIKNNSFYLKIFGLIKKYLSLKGTKIKKVAYSGATKIKIYKKIKHGWI